MAVRAVSKLAVVLPRHAASPLTWQGGAAPVASPGKGFRAPAPTPKGVPPLDTRPTLRGLDARQRCVPLHRQSGSLAPRSPRVRLSRPTPRRKAFRLSTPDQPCAGWMRGNGVSRCSGVRDIAALTRPSPRPPPKPRVSGFVCRHPRPAPCRAGLAAGARPLHPDP